MKLLKNWRAAEPAEDPYVVARLNEIAARSKGEASLYQAVEKARKVQRTDAPSKGFGKAPQQ